MAHRWSAQHEDVRRHEKRPSCQTSLASGHSLASTLFPDKLESRGAKSKQRPGDSRGRVCESSEEAPPHRERTERCVASTVLYACMCLCMQASVFICVLVCVCPCLYTYMTYVCVWRQLASRGREVQLASLKLNNLNKCDTIISIQIMHSAMLYILAVLPTHLSHDSILPMK